MFWQKQQDELIQLHEQESREFWKYIGKLGTRKERKFDIDDLVDEDGQPIYDEDAKLERWKRYFDGLLNSNATSDTVFNYNVNHINPPDEVINNLQQHVLNRHISVDEVMRAVQRAKNGKAAGYDEITIEILKDPAIFNMLCILFNNCFDSGLVPTQWKKGIITPIHKPGSKGYNDPKFFRGITLACTMYKLYCSILNARLSLWAEEMQIIQDEQNGFRKSRSCIDHLSSLTSIIDSRKALKKQTFAAFIDFKQAYDTINRDALWTKLSRYGLHGKILGAIKGIYSSVECCVRVNGLCSDWFDVKTGLKQGCIMSSFLFNMYINDLITSVNELRKGILIDGNCVSLLCYADDIVLLANNATDLQCMLDKVNEWCTSWQMTINVHKTKVVHFRNQSIQLYNIPFTIDGKELDMVHSYKYLGLHLHEHLDMTFTAKHVAKAAQRALGLLIAKDKAHGGMPFDIFTKLYDTLVQSVIDYGAAIWGFQNYNCINNVQNRAIKYFLGVNKRTSNAVSIGDTGWTSQTTRQWIKICHLISHLMNMDHNRITYKIFRWSFNLAIRKFKNWAYKVIKHFRSLDIHINIHSEISFQELKQMVLEKMQMNERDIWQQELQRNIAKNGQGRNKLRLYKSFKHEISTECYVKMNLSRKRRSALAKFRSGTAPIGVELGRYNGTPYEERLCFHCNNSIEDEYHVLFHCPLYHDIRQDMVTQANTIVDNVDELSEGDKLGLVLSHEKLVRIVARTCANILDRRRQAVH